MFTSHFGDPNFHSRLSEFSACPNGWLMHCTAFTVAHIIFYIAVAGQPLENQSVAGPVQMLSRFIVLKMIPEKKRNLNTVKALFTHGGAYFCSLRKENL